jgi:hypothetical protein
MTEDNEKTISAKALIVAAMWLGWGIMGDNLFSSGASVDLLVILIPLLVVAFFTLVIWMGPALFSIIESRADKAKRSPSDVLAAIMELMGEDEREKFKETLKQRMLDNVSSGIVDGELPLDSESLESLLNEDNEEKTLSY